MTYIEDHCVQCFPEGRTFCTYCDKRRVKVIECDTCGAPAVYRWDGEDWCESCLKNAMIQTFSNMPVSEMADVLSMGLTPYYK